MFSAKSSTIGRFVSDMALTSRALFDFGSAKVGDAPRQKDTYLLISAMCFILTIDVDQLTFMVAGAIFYICFKKGSLPRSDKFPVRAKKVEDCNLGIDIADNSKLRRQPRLLTQSVRPTGPPPPNVVRLREMRTPTTKPIEQPVFHVVGWEAEVTELLSSIVPTQESHAAVKIIAENVRASIHRSFPEVEVVGCAAGDFRRGKAFNVAVPEVDIVIRIKPDVLINRFTGSRWNTGRISQSNMSKVQKAALRECTEILVSGGKYKFRRSAFGSFEPKVTLLAPNANGDNGVPIDLSINAATPLQNMALLTECERMDPRAKELILLVRRWTKDRGVCHAAKGYLSPYLWSLLTIYFLQVGVEEEGPVLPPLNEFDLSYGFSGKQAIASSESKWLPARRDGQRKSTASLFKEFVCFYSTKFDWCNEAVSIRLGTRSPPNTKLPLHTMACGDVEGRTFVGISIEDPFLTTRNLGVGLNSATFTRSREELQRAHELCSRNASLTELLELWAPPECPEGK
eukprot:TRINITY_DN69395_c0_g1_i1.p1 TRINITY_DN69395_c0_g1~~TRINITY_DN69395_c0_g1_i1.p1  ORF type:complete len:514 (+),score=81.77 TRINITY_DN69395_c0_g1_i1:135-1676(+)